MRLTRTSEPGKYLVASLASVGAPSYVYIPFSHLLPRSRLFLANSIPHFPPLRLLELPRLLPLLSQPIMIRLLGVIEAGNQLNHKTSQNLFQKKWDNGNEPTIMVYVLNPHSSST